MYERGLCHKIIPIKVYTSYSTILPDCEYPEIAIKIILLLNIRVAYILTPRLISYWIGDCEFLIENNIQGWFIPGRTQHSETEVTPGAENRSEMYYFEVCDKS